MGAIRKALRWLSDRGLAEEVEGVADTWRLRERYRLNVLAASAGAFEALQTLGPTLDTTDDTAPPAEESD